MIKNLKKAFTIIELVIVIAVIAILAAVMIPTYSSLVEKANQSADIQAAKQMNTQLAAEAVTTDMTITDVYSTLEEGGMTAKEYTPLSKDTYYFWDSVLNRILYTDSDYKVIYPENYKNVTHKTHQWFSLNGKIREKSVEPVSGTYNITNAEELYWVANKVSDKTITGDVKINISATEIDLMGASATFVINYGHSLVTGFSLIGSSTDNGTIIKGLAQLAGTTNWDNQDFAAGLVSRLYINGNSEIKNITIEDSVIGDIDGVTGCVGGLVGEILGEINNVSIENCYVKNSKISSKITVGGFIGQIQQAEVNIKNCGIENVDVYCKCARSGITIGDIYNKARVTLDKNFSEWANNCTLNLVKSEPDYEWLTLEDYKLLGFSNASAISGTTTIVKENYIDNGDPKVCYYMFSNKAYASVLYTTIEAYIKYGTDCYFNHTSSSDIYSYNEIKIDNNTSVLIPYRFITE